MHFCDVKFFIIISVFSVFLQQSCSGPSGNINSKKSSSYQVAFYNVENLFDTINAPGKNDGEYTPESKKKYNTVKYYEKLDHLEQVLASIDSISPLVCIGLAEVENKDVLEDLVELGFLKENKFKIVHFESPDFRGIDVALLYRSDLFKVDEQEALYIDLKDSNRTTRDILKVKGRSVDGKSSIIYVNHWPSRWGGTEKTNPKRIAAAQVLKNSVDAEFSKDSKARILIMGDLNDYPDNESVLEVLGADSVKGGKLYNATWPLHKIDSLGTHNYKGHWGVLDHVIVSNELSSEIDTVYAHKKKFMLYQNKKGEWLPSRSYSRSKYYGGYSDHLPIVIKFK